MSKIFELTGNNYSLFSAEASPSFDLTWGSVTQFYSPCRRDGEEEHEGEKKQKQSVLDAILNPSNALNEEDTVGNKCCCHCWSRRLTTGQQVGSEVLLNPWTNLYWPIVCCSFKAIVEILTVPRWGIWRLCRTWQLDRDLPSQTGWVKTASSLANYLPLVRC